MLRAFFTRVSLAGLAAALAVGCATVAPLAIDPPEPGPMSGDIVERFCYSPEALDNSLSLLNERRNYAVYDVTLTAPGQDPVEDPPITLEYYAPSGDAPAPVVLVLPILNGQKLVMRPFATHFAANGYAAVIVDTAQRKTLVADMLHPEAAIREAVVRHRRVLDWIESRPDIDPARIGVFGASLGGFNALYLAALDARVRAVVPALVAGDLPYVFIHSDERRIMEAVAAAKSSLSMTDDELQVYLEEHIETDLLTLAPHIRPDRVLMVIAERDKSVPYRKQVELRAALGNPEALYLPSGHVTASAYLFPIQSRALEFFDQKLRGDDIRSVAILPTIVCAPSDRLPR